MLRGGGRPTAGAMAGCGCAGPEGASAQPGAEGRRRGRRRWRRGPGPAALLRRWRRRDPASRSRGVKRGEALFGRRRKQPSAGACAMRPIKCVGWRGCPGSRSRVWRGAERWRSAGGGVGASEGGGGLRDPRLHPYSFFPSRERCGGDSDSHPRSRGPRLPLPCWMLWGWVSEGGRGAMGARSGRARSPLPR